MLLDRLCKSLERCNEEVVIINIEGAITIPYCIERFEFVELEESICFGEVECESYPFDIRKETISNIKFLNYEDECVHVVFDVKNDEFVTRLCICCDVALEVDYE